MISATEKSPKGITKKSMGQNNVKFGWVFAKSLPNNIDSHKANIASKPVNHSMSFVIFIIFSSNVFNFTKKKLHVTKIFDRFVLFLFWTELPEKSGYICFKNEPFIGCFS